MKRILQQWSPPPKTEVQLSFPGRQTTFKFELKTSSWNIKEIIFDSVKTLKYFALVKPITALLSHLPTFPPTNDCWENTLIWMHLTEKVKNTIREMALPANGNITDDLISYVSPILFNIKKCPSIQDDINIFKPYLSAFSWTITEPSTV